MRFAERTRGRDRVELSTRRAVKTTVFVVCVRHYDKWWHHDEAWERYDYSYTDDELMEWLPKIRQLDEEAPLTLVTMNNHWQGQAAGTARQLKMLMEGHGD